MEHLALVLWALLYFPSIELSDYLKIIIAEKLGETPYVSKFPDFIDISRFIFWVVGLIYLQ